MTELEQLKQQAQELTQRIEELEIAGKANGGGWLPNLGEAYWFQSSGGEVAPFTFGKGSSDTSIFNTQRVYPTKQLAEANDHRKEKIAVWNKFREMETEAVDWNNKNKNKFYITYNYIEKQFRWGCYTSSQCIPDGEWYTTSQNACEWVIANMQTELKKIWRV